MIWTVSRVDGRCGSRGCAIPAGDPVAVLARGRVRWCQACAEREGFPIDWTEVENERWRLEHELAREAARRLQAPDITRLPPPVVLTKPKPPKPYTQVGDLFDPKSLAAGRDE